MVRVALMKTLSRSALLRGGLAAIACALPVLSLPVFTSPAFAQSDEIRGNLAARYDRASRLQSAVPNVLSEEERTRYQRIFAAIDAQEWETVSQTLKDARGETLYQIALAQFYTHAKSPRVSADQIAKWFEQGVDLPQSLQLGRMGAKRGLERLPEFPTQQGFRYQGEAAKRIRPKSVRDGTMPNATAAAIREAIKGDDPLGAYELLLAVDEDLSPEARAEWRQRVAWSFYIENDDENALALAEKVSEGTGPWVAEGEWVAGLAPWRLGHCAVSSEAFARSAAASTNVELTAAAHYWAHRALIRCREPGQAQEHLTAAARHHDTLYGMLAGDQLGIDPAISNDSNTFTLADWENLEARPNIRVAAALMEIGRDSLADEVLRYEAKIGPQALYSSRARFARALGLPSTQLFMAYHAPYGVQADTSLRYPVASWRPKTGWRVDPALAFAHALQESNFRASAVSPANARGLMQIRPGTARDHSQRLNLGASYSDLADPEVNLTYGQQHLETLRDAYATEGKLLKIMAAYNAGLTPVSRWNSEILDFDDPLLWMESIPYWETRGYVAIVMRNYWMYQRAAGVPSASRRALAEGRWPDFPVHTRSLNARWEQGR